MGLHKAFTPPEKEIRHALLRTAGLNKEKYLLQAGEELIEHFGIFHAKSKPVASVAPAKTHQQKSAPRLETGPPEGPPEAFVIRRREPV
jgi:hypothetical protein